MANYLVIGLGRIGLPLAERLAVDNWVVGVARTPKAHSHRLNFWQKDALTLSHDELLPFTHIVVIITPSDAHDDKVARYQASYLAVCQYLASFDLLNLQRIVFVSSTSVYGENSGGVVDTATPAKPREPTAQVLLEAERCLKRAFGERCVIVRPSGIYGRTATRMLRVADTAYQGMPRYHFTNRIFDGDLVNVLFQVLTQAQVKSLYLATDKQPTTSFELVSWLCQRLNLPMPMASDDTPSGKRIVGNVDDWLSVPNYQIGYEQVISGSQ